jgi:hypothetical protein
MKIAAAFVGVAGGLAGLYCTGVSVAASIAESMAPEEQTAITRDEVAGFMFSLVGLVGAFIVPLNPKMGGAILLVAAVGGSIGIGTIYALAALLLVLAGILGVAMGFDRSSEPMQGRRHQRMQGSTPLAGDQPNASTAELPRPDVRPASTWGKWPRFDPNKPGDLERAYAEAVRLMRAQQAAPASEDESKKP